MLTLKDLKVTPGKKIKVLVLGCVWDGAKGHFKAAYQCRL